MARSEILENLKTLVRSLLGTGARDDGDQATQALFRKKYKSFQELLESNAELLKIVADMEQKLRGDTLFGMGHVRAQSTRAVFHALRMAASFESLACAPQPRLKAKVEELQSRIKAVLESRRAGSLHDLVLPYAWITREMVDAVGGKSANLGELRNRAGMPVPRGFAVTTAAFERFFAHAGLWEEIKRIKLGIIPDAPGSLEEASEEIQRAVLTAPMPQDLETALLDAHADLAAECGLAPEALRVSLRSSAIGEDSELSFAGQYLSVLNVPRQRLLTNYRYVVASLYTPRAISYRLLKGIVDEDMAMSVACLEMIDSVASGVMYSRHPFEPQDLRVLINAVWGLGPYAVDGVVTPDAYFLGREGLAVEERRIAVKPVMLVCAPNGVLEERPVEAGRQGLPCLSDDQARTLAGWALTLERHHGVAQDIEWALSPKGELILLQARPLGLAGGTGVLPADLPAVEDRQPLLAGGETAQPGVGVGPAHLVRTDDDLADFPEGGVLVAAHSSPTFMVVMNKAQAIVTDTGSITGHMASLCREFGVPTLLGLGSATRDIPNGEVVTVDAYRGAVYPGRVEELAAFRSDRTAMMAGTPVHETLRRVAELVVPLRLTDPKAPEFNAAGCASLHDVMRLLHERSYAEMFKLGDMASGEGGSAMRLRAQTGLDLHVIDLGGGVERKERRGRDLRPEDVVSPPFNALLGGLLLDQDQLSTPRPVQMKGLLSVVGQQMINNPGADGQRFGDKSYAIISDKYLNFSSRVGYHYGVLDCYCGRTESKNYITFSFKGGAADEIKRERRARAIGLILAANGFAVEVQGDRVAGRFAKRSTAATLEKLWLMGKLLQFTRQTDMLMVDESSVQNLAECFISGRYVLTGSCPVTDGPKEGPKEGSKGPVRG